MNEYYYTNVVTKVRYCKSPFTLPNTPEHLKQIGYLLTIGQDLYFIEDISETLLKINKEFNINNPYELLNRKVSYTTEYGHIVKIYKVIN